VELVLLEGTYARRLLHRGMDATDALVVSTERECDTRHVFNEPV